MHNAVLKMLLLFGFAQCCTVTTLYSARAEKTAYAFPKRIQSVQRQEAEDDFDEVTTFSDEDDFEEEFANTLTAQSQQPKRRPAKMSKKKHQAHGKYFRMDIAPQYSYMTVHSHGRKNERGGLGGITGEAQYKKRDHVYADASFLWEHGKIKADNRRSHTWKEAIAQGMIGYTASITSHMSTTPYVGFGYRKVMDHKSTVLPSRTSLNYYQYFVPFGFLTDYCFSKRVSLSLNLKAMPPVDSRLYIVNMTGQFWKLKNKGCYEADLPFKWTAAITKYVDFDFTLNPFFKYWVIGPSRQLHLPKRTQVYWGGELQLGFSL